MDRREDALRDALVENAAENERWEQYRKENEIAIENLDMFSKRLTVDVMVPVGRKAYMPGQLVHTNEVLVGHYQGYFSKCSAHKAKELCELRIRKAQEQLIKLQTEADLWQNKLEKPYAGGVLPKAVEQEIIEDYDELQESKWREEHRVRVKQAKLRERQEREKQRGWKSQNDTKGKEKSDEDILKMLEDAELMEELDKELNTLALSEVKDETIRQLMIGEMKLPPPKTRIAHSVKEGQEVLELHTQNVDKLPKIVKKIELAQNTGKVPATNNNYRTNPELSIATWYDAADDGNDSDDSIVSESERLPDEVQFIKEQAKFLSLPDQIGFYEYQIQILKHKMLKVPLINQQGIDEKIRLIGVLENLQELLELVEEAVGAEEIALYAESEKQEQQAERDAEESQDISSSNPQLNKRRISFALEDQTLEFCKNEAVSHMLPKADSTSTTGEARKRDIISLDKSIITSVSFERSTELPPVPIDKKQIILGKVEQHLHYIAEQQSKQDFDLVQKILDSSLGCIQTLHINFTHSAQPGRVENVDLRKEAEEEEFVPSTPDDFYKLYVKALTSEKSPQPTTLFINGYEGEDKVKTPILRETERALAYEDPRLQFSIPKKGSLVDNSTKREISHVSQKSILRNKTAMQQEKQILTNSNSENKNHSNNKRQKKKKVTAIDEEEYTSAYNKVMHDVVEKPITEPEPLPQGAYIDMHTPKKRVSRFKQMRAGIQKS